jgi:D-glycero-alpha-D-manno-heptose 1-phosphate guanylyltransferase
MSVGYMGETIVRAFGDDFKGVPITYAVENAPLGTGGAIRLALSECAEDNVLILNGDTYFDVNLDGLSRFHASKDADISVALREMTNFNRYGAVELDPGRRITAFREKERTSQGYINGGVYCMAHDVFAGLDLPEKFSFEDFLAQNLTRLKLFGMPAVGNFIDIGIPADYASAQTLLPEWVPV